MKPLLSLATLLVLLLAVPGTSWAGERGGRRHHPRREARPPVEVGLDRNGDGRITNLERIRYQQQQRFERLHGR